MRYFVWCLSSFSSGPANIEHGAQRSAVDVPGSNISNRNTKIRFFNYQVGDGGIHVSSRNRSSNDTCVRIIQYVPHRTSHTYSYVLRINLRISTLVVKINKPHNITVDRRPTITSANLAPRVAGPTKGSSERSNHACPIHDPRCYCCC